MKNKQDDIQRKCFALDLVDDPGLIARYESYHKKETIWPEIVAGIKAAGIRKMDIYRAGNRLMMLIEAPAELNLTDAFKQLETMPRQKEWARLMAGFQLRIAAAEPGEHWAMMKHVFDLNE